MNRKDYYLVLGVPQTATTRGIKRAFRRLAKTHHPDQTGSEESGAFKEIVEAYEVLSDPEKRRAYDHRVAVSEVREPAWGPPMAGYRTAVGADPARRRYVEDLVPEPNVEPLIPEPTSIPDDSWTFRLSAEELMERFFLSLRRRR